MRNMFLSNRAEKIFYCEELYEPPQQSRAIYKYEWSVSRKTIT